jgi:hypothetical protein
MMMTTMGEYIALSVGMLFVFGLGISLGTDIGRYKLLKELNLKLDENGGVWKRVRTDDDTKG